MGIRSSEEVMAVIHDYAVEILDKQIQKKAIDTEISEIKQDAKEDGIAIGKVMKVLNKIKARAKMSEADKMEEDILEEKIEADETIQEKIALLNA